MMGYGYGYMPSYGMMSPGMMMGGYGYPYGGMMGGYPHGFGAPWAGYYGYGFNWLIWGAVTLVVAVVAYVLGKRSRAGG